MYDILTLITQSQGVNDCGDPVITETVRNVFCGVRSIGMKEFYQAHTTGLQPEIAFVLADYLDYNGESIVEYKGHRYHILRTFHNGQRLELTCYTEVNAT
jgi:phage head-tail adaptor, putative, SPP1 family